jgi:hypothetical protein
MKQIIYHIMIPAIPPVLFFINAAMPVEVLGCRTRGLVAVIIAFASVLAGIAFAYIGRKKQSRGDKNFAWWLVSASILAVPPIALLILA